MLLELDSANLDVHWKNGRTKLKQAESSTTDARNTFTKVRAKAHPESKALNVNGVWGVDGEESIMTMSPVINSKMLLDNGYT